MLPIQESGTNPNVYMRFLQLNRKHCQLTHFLLKTKCVLGKQIDGNWSSNLRDNWRQLECSHYSNGFVRATVRYINIYSRYLPPSINDGESKYIIDSIVAHAQQ